MPALVIGSHTVDGVVSAQRTVVEAVERERSYNNTMLATQIATDKASVAITISHVTATEKGNIETALAGTPPITCSGDALGGSASYHVEKGGSELVLGVLPRRYNMNFVLHLA